MLPLALEAELRDLASQADAKSPVTLSLDSGKGSLAVEGALGLSPLAFDGKLRIVDFSLPPLLGCIDAPGVALLRKGNARADLQIALAPRDAAQADLSPTDLRVEGTIGLAGIDVGEPKTSKDFAAAWKDLEVGIRELTVPGLIGAGDAGPPLGIVVNLDRVRLLEPSFQITRVQGGYAPPLAAETPGTPPPLTSLRSGAWRSGRRRRAGPESLVEIAEARTSGGARSSTGPCSLRPLPRSTSSI